MENSRQFLQSEDRSDDSEYLERVAELSFGEVSWTDEAVADVRDFLSPWKHNIRLRPGIFTSYVEDYYPAHEVLMRIASQELDGRFAGKRVLDLGCLEGYFSVECALQGATVLGVEGKIINVKKCEFVKSVLRLDDVTFVKDDAMRVTRERYGSFDVVLALGLLYHLEDPFSFLANMAELCEGFMLLDTHVALLDDAEAVPPGWEIELSPLKEFAFRGETYRGRLYREFAPSDTTVVKEFSITSSLENELSVWLTEASLVDLLHDAGFEQTAKLVFPDDGESWWASPGNARVLILATRRQSPFASKIFDGASR
jgi:SAM-dependent methyltransferase